MPIFVKRLQCHCANAEVYQRNQRTFNFSIKLQFAPFTHLPMKIDSLQTLALQLEVLVQLKECFLVFEEFRTCVAEAQQDGHCDSSDGDNVGGAADQKNRPVHSILDPLIFSSDAQKIFKGLSLLEKIVVAIEGSELSNVKSAVAKAKKYSFHVENFLMAEFIEAIQNVPMNFDWAKVDAYLSLAFRSP